ncbi:MAG: RNA polymerase sigma-70 factor [Bacteroidetes bacterium]|nr:RNA polymerase sigma-70 factor [Bacteroidota bacterium]
MENIDHHDKQILKLLVKDPDRAIDLLFRSYYSFLCKSIYRIIPDKNKVEDLAQDVFYEIWRKRDHFHINTSLKAYLRRAGMNKALNFIRDQKIKWDDAEELNFLESENIGANEKLEANELQTEIELAINDLPERCRIIFSLSRFEEMTYQQIADELGISIKTVENQISKALKVLRKKLGQYLSVVLLFAVLSSSFF